MLVHVVDKVGGRCGGRTRRRWGGGRGGRAGADAGARRRGPFVEPPGLHERASPPTIASKEGHKRAVGSHQKKATSEQSVRARVEQAARERPVREQPAVRGTPCDMAILEDQFADLNVGHRRPVVINKQLLYKF
jgi:hypothetical protein